MPPLDLLASGVFEGARIGLAAIGFALIFYTTKELHFAFGVLATASAYSFFLVMDSLGWPAVLAVLTGLGFGALIGAGVQFLFYRRMRDELGVLLFSFGLAVIVENVLHLVFGPSEQVLPSSAVTRTIAVGDEIIGRYIDVVGLVAFLLVWLFLWNMLERQRIGLAVRAVMKDPAMSELVGIRSGRIKVFAYAVGSAIGAISGMVDVARTGIKPSSGFDLMLLAFIATILGAGSLNRVAAWAMGLGIFMALVAWRFPTELRLLLTFTVMLAYLVLRPGQSGTGGVKGMVTSFKYAAAGRAADRAGA
jgi:branched-chain amino acid transport system permease protein